MTESVIDPAMLMTEGDARRVRLARDVEELSDRMRPGNLLRAGYETARDTVSAEADKVMRQTSALASQAANSSITWASENRGMFAGGVAAALLATIGAWVLCRRASARRTVPLYAAYAMEDPSMMNDETTNSAWNRVRDEAANIGNKAGGTYYAARSRAASLADNAAEYADEASERARQAMHQARGAADDAREWAVRQSREHPVGLIVAGVAAGALLAVLLPKGRAKKAGAVRDAATDVAAQAEKAYADVAPGVKGAVREASEKARSGLHHVAAIASDIIEEVSADAADKLRKL